MGGTGASTGEWLSLIKFITLLHLGCRWWAAHASQVTGRGVVEGDPAVGGEHTEGGFQPRGSGVHKIGAVCFKLGKGMLGHG